MRVIPKLLSIRISRNVGIKKLSSCFPFHWPWSPEWSHLSPPTLFFCKNIYQLLPSDGVVIIDDAGITRHVMTTSLDSKELATTVFSLVPVLKKQKVSAEWFSDGRRISRSESASLSLKVDCKYEVYRISKSSTVSAVSIFGSELALKSFLAFSSFFSFKIM